MKAMGVMVILAASVSCFSTHQYEAAHEQRVAQIDSEYQAERAERVAQAQQLLRQADDLKRYLVAIKPGSRYEPVDRILKHADVVTAERPCDDLAAQYQSATGDAATQLADAARDCYGKVFVDVALPQLQARYFRADSAWVAKQVQVAPDTKDIEALLAYSHNTVVLDEIRTEKAQIRAMLQQQLADLGELRDQAVAVSAEQRDEDIDEARERNRQRWMAVANGMQALGQSMQQTSARPAPVAIPGAYGGMSPGIAAAQAGKTCSSDYDCAYGSQCVKANYSTSGYCAQTVNSFGVATYQGPRVESVEPKMPVSTDCKLPLDCPIGFTCDTASGACLKQ